MSAIAHDPIPYEGVRGKPFDLAWDFVDEDTGEPEDLSDVVEIVVKVRLRVMAGQSRPPAVAFKLTEGKVTVDLETGQICAPVSEEDSLALMAGVHDVQLDLTRVSGPEPTAATAFLNLKEDL